MRPLLPYVLCFAATLAGCAKRSLDLNDDTSDDMNGPSLSGTFARCADTIMLGSMTNNVSESGFGGGLTLAQIASSLSATYAYPPDDIMQTLPFTLSAEALASLTASEQLSGFSGLCVVGAGSMTLSPATMLVDAGTLQYQAGTVFVSTEGMFVDSGDCGTPSSPGSYALICDQASTPIEVAPPAVMAPLLSGQYACQSNGSATIAAGLSSDESSNSGGAGTLTLTAEGSDVTLAYVGDGLLSGTLHLTATSAATALVNDHQTVSSMCTTPPSAADSPISSLPITAGALSVFGAQLTLSLTATVGASEPCAGAYMVTTLTCSLM